ncbi:T9SS type A sorting domain-containing protein [Candidatus Poribacteria bacterium]|nr:T9SS type A sorting domain-containing protein [Candidatus Poribacteria bacterium]
MSVQNDGGPAVEPAAQAPSPFPVDQGNFISLWNVATGRMFATPFVNGGVYSLAFSPDSAMTASGGNKTIHLWETATGEHIKTLPGHTGGVNSLAFSPNGLTLASGSSDKTIRLWEVTTGEDMKTLTGHTDEIYSLAFSPNGLTLASGSWDKTIHLWDATTGAPLRNLEGHTERIERLLFSPDGATLISQSSDKTIRLWNTATGKPIKILTGYMEDLQSLALSPDGTVLAAGEKFSFDKEYAIYLWDTTTGKHIKTLTGYEAAASSLAFSPDGTILANGSYTMNLWNVATGKHIKTFTKHTEVVHNHNSRNRVQGLAFSPDGTILASAGTHLTNLWNVASGKRLKNFNELGRVNSLAFSPDGTTFASGGHGKIDLWNVASGEHIRMLKEHKGWIQSLAFSPDGTKLVSGNRKYIGHPYVGVITGSLWNVVTGEHLQILTTTHETSKDNSYNVSFASDEPVLASTDSESGIVLLWDFNAVPSVLEEIPEDVNGDGVLNIQDLVWVAENLGQMGPNTADVNGDGIVDIRDLVKVASAIVASAAAPSIHLQPPATLTAAEVQQWLAQAQQFNLTDAISQRGIRFLEQLLDTLTPIETALLPNYPNPFNPETWIPYQLAEPAEVTVTIYAVDGTVVRTLELGHQSIGIYHDRHRAVYWNGKNELGEPASSGVYFYTLTAKEFKATRKMIIQK